MSDRRWVPPALDLSKPSVARIYDYALGGKDNLAIDRKAAEEVLAGSPEAFQIAVENRAFLIRAVDYLAREAGLRQFIDNGSGLPTQNNVHQVAQCVDPGARVVYVDNDPIVLAHGRALLVQNDVTTVITADMRRPDEIIDHLDTRALIDFDEPVAVLFISVLHCIDDEAEPAQVVRRMLDAVPSGSYLALSHIVSDDRDAAESFTRAMRERADWGRVRSPEEVAGFFDALELVEPGLVDVNVWRNDHPMDFSKKVWELGGVGRKP